MKRYEVLYTTLHVFICQYISILNVLYEVLGCLLKKTFFLTGEFFLPHEGKIKTPRGRIICIVAK